MGELSLRRMGKTDTVNLAFTISSASLPYSFPCPFIPDLLYMRVDPTATMTYELKKLIATASKYDLIYHDTQDQSEIDQSTTVSGDTWVIGSRCSIVFDGSVATINGSSSVQKLTPGSWVIYAMKGK